MFPRWMAALVAAATVCALAPAAAAHRYTFTVESTGNVRGIVGPDTWEAAWTEPIT